MKLAVRVFVLSLVAAGAYASTHTNRTQEAASFKAGPQVISSAMPVPTCLPSGCGGTVGGKGNKGGLR